MTTSGRVAAFINLFSVTLTAAPYICVATLLIIAAHVRLVLGSWPLVYGDDAGDWFVMLAGLIAFAAYLVSLAGLAIWAPATGLAAKFSSRPIFLRRLLLFALGWALLGALDAFDGSGELMSLLNR